MKNNLKKHEFSFNLSGLQEYTDETGGLLLMEAIVKSKTATIGYVQSGVKGTQAINLLTSTLAVQDGGCGFTPSGSTIFTQRDITVCNYKVNETLCPADLNDYWAGQFLNAGSYNENVPFEEAISTLKKEQISKFVDDKLWLATTGGTDCFEGFSFLFSTGAADPVVFVTSPTTPAVGVMLDVVDELITALPDKVQEDDDLVVIMSMSNYRKYTIDLRTANYYNFGTETKEAGTLFQVFHPGTNVLVVGIGPLSGSDQIVCGKRSQLIVGTDLMTDSETLEIFYDRNEDEVRVRSNFKVGAQIPFPSNWASNGLN